ncbi:MAG: hypothetical protein JWL94_431 [Microbacteriaceae bacterium]|jgi:hypothetical protein|nr:hypothetical protein [Microbacteriaceae bacterium]
MPISRSIQTVDVRALFFIRLSSQRSGQLRALK